MSTWKLFMIVAALLLFCGLLKECPDDTAHELEYERRQIVDTLVYIDTIRYFQLIPRDSAVVRYVNIPLKSLSPGATPSETSTDSLPYCAETTAFEKDSITLPVISHHYADSTFEAWVSGPIDPRLDSIYVYPRLEIIRISPPQSHHRFHFGVQAGYGMTLRGPSPYLGLGFSYSIF